MRFKGFKKNGVEFFARFEMGGKIRTYSREALRVIRDQKLRQGKQGETCALLIKFVIERWPDTCLGKRIKKR